MPFAIKKSANSENVYEKFHLKQLRTLPMNDSFLNAAKYNENTTLFMDLQRKVHQS